MPPLRFCFASMQASRRLQLCHPAGLDAPLVLRPKPKTRLHGGFEAQTAQLSISSWPSRDLLDVDACPVSIKLLVPPSYLTRPTPSSSVQVLFLFNAPRGLPVTPSGLLESLNPSLQAFVLHRPWFIGTNLSLDLHHIRRLPYRILHLRITSQETSKSHNIFNHSSSRVDHHWSL
jgi:hypothetical protein